MGGAEVAVAAADVAVGSFDGVTVEVAVAVASSTAVVAVASEVGVSSVVSSVPGRYVDKQASLTNRPDGMVNKFAKKFRVLSDVIG